VRARQAGWAVLVVPAGYAVGAAWGALTDLADRDPGRVADLLVALVALAALAAGALTVIVTDLHDKIHRERQLNQELRRNVRGWARRCRQWMDVAARADADARAAVGQTPMARTLEDVRRLPQTGERP
jgi:hypothetical protein